MFIILDASDSKAKIIFLNPVDTKIIQREFLAEDGDSLVEVLSNALKSQEKTMGSIRGIAVVAGAGRFTSTRVAVTTANTLAYALGVPVAAVSKEFNPKKVVEEIISVPIGRYVSAKYSGEARIGGN